MYVYQMIIKFFIQKVITYKLFSHFSGVYKGCISSEGIPYKEIAISNLNMIEVKLQLLVFFIVIYCLFPYICGPQGSYSFIYPVPCCFDDVVIFFFRRVTRHQLKL